MAIKYFLLENKLLPNKKNRRAIVLSNGTKTMEDVIIEAAQKGTMVTKTDLRAVTEIMFEVMAEILSEGYTLVTPIFKVRPSITGVFEDKASSFDPNAHNIKATLVAGALLKQEMAKAKLVKVETRKRLPLILEFMDESTGFADKEVTPGGMGIISGYRLQFDPALNDEGLFFTDASGMDTKVERFAKRMPKELIFQIPQSLSSGSYSLTLRSRALSKALRESLPCNLKVL